MQFRPCIDIHNGTVKQIVGGTLKDTGDSAKENFISEHDAAWFAGLYDDMGLSGGHVIMLNHISSPYYEKTKQQALRALSRTPGRLQVGGGISKENAGQFLDAGASHVIVTSAVFSGGRILMDELKELVKVTGKERLVLDLSCKRNGGDYYICTDRWQKKTDVRLTRETMAELSSYCDEFLIHAVDVEGKSSGIEKEVAAMLGDFGSDNAGFSEKITYAGGVGSFGDLEELKELGRGHVNVTIGSALDIFGGTMELEKVIHYVNR